MPARRRERRQGCDSNSPTGASSASLLAAAGRRSALCSAVEPDILETPAVVDAVDVDRHALDIRLPASGGLVVEDDRAGDVLLQLAIDLPHHLQALLLVELLRLRLEQLRHLGIAVVVVVAQ